MARYLITSALPYINGIKHLGNLAGSMLPADVYARSCRMAGDEVLFICGTDEHGTPAELAAFDKGMDVAEYCDQQYRLQADVCRDFGLSFDYFGRSSSPQNYKLTQELALDLEERGLIEERSTKQLFCLDDGPLDVYGHKMGRFLPDRYVEGTCPHCGYDGARGDQCDSCGAQIDAVDLINPRSKISGSTNIEVRETTHLFLLQSKLSEAIVDWVARCDEWPDFACSIARKWLREGLRDRSITRDLSWGVPIVTRDGTPRKGFENKSFYVWFDAPIAYIAITQQWADATGGDWERWWRLDKGANDVCYVQYMGQDNVPFHTVSFPATIIGSGKPFRLVDRLKAFRWLLWGDSKFSTSRGQGIFMDEALRMRPTDEWRWYLIANSPETSDASFRWEHFREVVNNELLNKFGNLVNRVLAPAIRRFNGQVPAWPDEGMPYAAEALSTAADLVSRITEAYQAMEFRSAANATRALWDWGNRRVQQVVSTPAWRDNGPFADAAMRELLELVRLVAVLASPVVPTTSQRVLAAIGLDAAKQMWPDAKSPDLLNGLRSGTVISDPGKLFEFVPEMMPGTDAEQA